MFLLFSGDCYYPSGGWRDFVGVFPTYEAARERAKGDWWHIVDLSRLSMVDSGGDDY